jgi:hypothetical protein
MDEPQAWEVLGSVYYLGGKETHSRTSGVLDRRVLKKVADMLR